MCLLWKVDIVDRSDRCFTHLRWPMEQGSNFLVKPEVSLSTVFYLRCQVVESTPVFAGLEHLFR